MYTQIKRFVFIIGTCQAMNVRPFDEIMIVSSANMLGI